MHVKPLGDKVLLRVKKPETQTASGIVIASVNDDKSDRGVVVAVGAGAVIDGERVPMEVQEGDSVIFSRYSGTEVKIGDESLLLVREMDIMAVEVK